MLYGSYSICPHLSGSKDGACCSAANEFVKNIDSSDIRFCLSRHFEACYVYLEQLHTLAAASMSIEVEEKSCLTEI